MNKEVLEWLSSVLKISTESIDLHPLTPDASSRRYFRVLRDSVTQGVLCVENPFDEWDHPFLNLQKVWSRGGLQTPAIIAVNGKLGLILQEDLGDLSLQSFLSGGSSAWSLTGANSVKIDGRLRLEFSNFIIDDLVKISRLPKNSFKLKFDRSKLGFEWGWTWQHLISPTIKEDLSKEVMQDWSDVALQNSIFLEAHASVPTHRDFHSRNIMVKVGYPCYIDFQDGRLGTCYYDLASYLYDSYLPYDSSFESEILAKFHDKMKIPYNSKLYLAQVVQRTLKVAGSFASFKRLKNDDRYLSYILPTLKLSLMAIERMNVPEYFKLAVLIERILSERYYNV
jgi:aminoglycoside/choline kinase family phosphotransferase